MDRSIRVSMKNAASCVIYHELQTLRVVKFWTHSAVGFSLRHAWFRVVPSYTAVWLVCTVCRMALVVMMFDGGIIVNLTYWWIPWRFPFQSKKYVATCCCLSRVLTVDSPQLITWSDTASEWYVLLLLCCPRIVLYGSERWIQAVAGSSDFYWTYHC